MWHCHDPLGSCFNIMVSDTSWGCQHILQEFCTFCAASGPHMMLMAIRFLCPKIYQPILLLALKRKQGVGKADVMCCEIFS